MGERREDLPLLTACFVGRAASSLRKTTGVLNIHPAMKMSGLGLGGASFGVLVLQVLWACGCSILATVRKHSI